MVLSQRRKVMFNFFEYFKFSFRKLPSQPILSKSPVFTVITWPTRWDYVGCCVGSVLNTWNKVILMEKRLSATISTRIIEILKTVFPISFAKISGQTFSYSPSPSSTTAGIFPSAFWIVFLPFRGAFNVVRITTMAFFVAFFNFFSMFFSISITVVFVFLWVLESFLFFLSGKIRPSFFRGEFSNWNIIKLFTHIDNYNQIVQYVNKINVLRS